MEVENNGEPTDDEPDRMDLELLALGKKAGLNFEEINLLRVRDLIKFIKIYVGGGEEERENEARTATQVDFDRW